MIQIVTDTSSYLPADLIEDYEIVEIPTYIYWDDEMLLERVDITTPAIFEQIAARGSAPTTSQAPVDTFRAVYQSLLEEGPAAVLSIHVSGAMSGTVASAQSAATMLGSDQVIVYDSRSCAAGHALLVREAAHMAHNGHDLETILARLDVMREGMQFYCVASTLEALSESGRLWKLARLKSAMGEVATPIITLTDGALDGHGAFETRADALAELHDLGLEGGRRLGGGRARELRLAITHADAADDARQLGDDLRTALAPGLFLLGELSPAFAMYFGRGAVAAAWCPVA